MTAPTDWVPILNTTAEVIPAGGLMSVVGVDATTGAFKVAKPSTDGDPTVCVNGFSLIPANGTGQGSFDPRAIIAYDPADGTPAVGDTWGAKSGTWLAKKGNAGFTVLGGPGLGLVNATRWQTPASGSGAAPSCGFSDGWAAFLTASACLELDAISSFGSCSGVIGTSILMRYDPAAQAWASTDVLTLPSGATATAKFTAGDGDGPHLDLVVSGGGSGSGSGSGSSGTYRLEKICSGGGQSIFAGPTRAGFDALCASPPRGGCSSNGFYLRVACVGTCDKSAPCCGGATIPDRLCIVFTSAIVTAVDGGSPGPGVGDVYDRPCWPASTNLNVPIPLTGNGSVYSGSVVTATTWALGVNLLCNAPGSPGSWALDVTYSYTGGCRQNSAGWAYLVTGTTDSISCDPFAIVGTAVLTVDEGASGNIYTVALGFKLGVVDPTTGLCASSGGGGGGGGGGGPTMSCGYGHNNPPTLTVVVSGGSLAGTYTAFSTAGSPDYWEFTIPTGGTFVSYVLEFFGSAWHIVGPGPTDETATGGQCAAGGVPFGLTFAGSTISGATGVSVS